MKNSVRTVICLSLAAIALPQAASAQDGTGTGFYMGVDLGMANLGDTDVTYYDAGGTFGGTTAQDRAETTFNAQNAFAIGGALGYDFGTIRSDLEVDYAKNSIESITFNSLNGTPVTLTASDRDDVCDYLEADSCGGSGNTFVIDGARVRQLSALLNLWVDIPVGGTIVPYAGGGLGIGGFETDGEGDASFAWQLGAGVAANLSPGMALSLDYRHRQIGATTIDYDANSGFEIEKLRTNTFSVGARFTF